ncbi:MAG: hypothetical protein VB013_08590 [Anaerolineaceae bacterium]|nr:hypothetical protein [Anaerolineaceae bacterium]
MKARIVKTLFASIVLLGLFLSSCIGTNPSDSPGQPTNSPESVLVTSKTLTSTATQKVKNTPLPSLTPYLTKTPTRTVLPSMTITATYQFPTDVPYSASISTVEPTNPDLLYQNATIGVLTASNYGNFDINLDDLSDNSPSKADLHFHFSHGSGGYFANLDPIPGVSVYYYSDLYGMNYEKCMEHYPFDNMNQDFYEMQSSFVGSGRDYCVITNEGRLSIIRFVVDSLYTGSLDTKIVQFVVSTYKKPVPQVFLPTPTITPGPSPTPGRYTGWNFTKKQEENLDRAALTLINAVASGDRETVATLIDFPLGYHTEGDRYESEIEDKDRFFFLYNAIFTKEIREEFKNATLVENMALYPSDPTILILPSCAIFFRYDGSIYGISMTDFWWTYYHKDN